MKELKKLRKAIEYSTKKHKGQVRKDGTPYINHPIRVTKNVLKYKKSSNIEILLVSAMLHDTIEDTDATYIDIVNNFGSEVGSLVLELTSDENIKNRLGKEEYLKIKMKNMSNWALIIKLCDRLDNVRDLKNTNDIEFNNKYIHETMSILKYLYDNRELSKTHINIIENILCSLIKLCSKDSNKIIELTNLLQNYMNKRDEVLDNLKVLKNDKHIKKIAI